jgi:hypothetical protein
MSVPRTGRALLTRNITFLILVLTSVRGWMNPQGLVRPERLGKFNRRIRLIGSRTRDLPACSIVPQPLRYRARPLRQPLKGLIAEESVHLSSTSHCRLIPNNNVVRSTGTTTFDQIDISCLDLSERDFWNVVFVCTYVCIKSRGSSGGIVTGYGLDDRGVGVRFPIGSTIFIAPYRPDRLWAHPASYPMCMGALSPGDKAAGV